MAERIAVRKRRVRDHVANRDAALDQIQQDNTTKANATMLNAQANMANTQQQMDLTRQRGANRTANTGLRNEGAIDLAGANNQALGARQQNRFGHEDKIGAIEYGRSVEDTKRDHDFKREMFGANREANVQDMETTHQNTMESEAFKMGGELYKTTGNPRLGAQMVSGDFNKVDRFTPPKLGVRRGNFKHIPAERDLNNNPLEGDAGQDRAFDESTGEMRSLGQNDDSTERLRKGLTKQYDSGELSDGLYKQLWNDLGL